MTLACSGHTASRCSRRSERGFSLLEVMTAAALMAAGLVVIAQLLIIAIDAARWSGGITMAATLAAQRLEQLRGLAFFVDEAGAAVTDSTTDLSVTPPAAAGGRGLLASPASALTVDTAGYVDYLDAAGQWVGTGTTAPRGAVYTRRWSVTPLAAHPNRALVLRVVVLRSSATSQAASLRAGDAPLACLKARKAR